MKVVPYITRKKKCTSEIAEIIRMYEEGLDHSACVQVKLINKYRFFSFTLSI